MFVNGAVGVWVADVEPVALIENDGAKLLSFDEFDECGHDGDHFIIGEHMDDFRLDAIDPCELVGAGCVGQNITQIGHVVAGDVDVAVISG